MTLTPVKLKRNAMIAVALLAAIAGVAVVATDNERSPRTETAATVGVRAASVERGELATAAAYLGISRDQLRRRLRSQVTLAAVADSTPGRTSAGLIDALLNARASALRAAGAQPRKRLSSRDAQLRERVTAEVNRAHYAHARTGGTRRSK